MFYQTHPSNTYTPRFMLERQLKRENDEFVAILK